MAGCMPDGIRTVNCTLVFVSVNFVCFWLAMIVLYVSCLEGWSVVVVSYCRRASCACIANAAQYGMAWSLHAMMVFFRKCHSSVGSLARVREVLFSSLTLAHSCGLIPSSTIMPSSWWPSCSRWSRMVTQDVAR